MDSAPNAGGLGQTDRRLPRPTAITVCGYKSIRDLQSFVLQPINVLVGANGSGKSNLVSALRMVRALGERRLGQFVGEAGGPNTLLHYGIKQTRQIIIKIDFECKAGAGYYRAHLRPTATEQLMFGLEDTGYPLVKGRDSERRDFGSGHLESAVPASDPGILREFQVFQFHDTSPSSGLRRRWYADDGFGLHPDGGNLAPFLRKLAHTAPAHYARIVDTIRLVAPFFDDFDFALPDDPASVRLNWRDRDSDYLFGPHQLSDGTLRAMALIALLAQPPGDLPGLIVLDEPEIGLHPYAIEILVGLIRSASVHSSIVLATQSVGLVNHFQPEEIVTVNRKAAASEFQRHTRESLADWLEDYSLGDLWERNFLGGNPAP